MFYTYLKTEIKNIRSHLFFDQRLYFYFFTYQIAEQTELAKHIFFCDEQRVLLLCHIMLEKRKLH